MPYKPWDEKTDPATPEEGYCTHDSLLFPCWHRPYMLLYEVSLAYISSAKSYLTDILGQQVLYEIMLEEVIPKLPESYRDKWIGAANTWRLPYWDWAQKKTRDGKDKPIYDVPLIAKGPRVEVVDLATPATTTYIDNPMFKFTMPKSKAMGPYGINDIDGVPVCRCVYPSPFHKPYIWIFQLNLVVLQICRHIPLGALRSRRQNGVDEMDQRHGGQQKDHRGT